MQRPTYSSVPPAHSPPLHHPVPQHVSTVPQLRSPPPPQPPSQPQSGYGYGQQDQGGGQGGGAGGYTHPAFGGFINDSTAQMGFQMGKNMAMAGQEMMGQNLSRWGLNTNALKPYFNVTNSYVANKLLIVLFPWRHRPWSRQQRGSPSGQEGFYLPPREDINSPDMYIPLMSFVTYSLLVTLLAGLHGSFDPSLLLATGSSLFAFITVELAILYLGSYFLSISAESRFLDLVAYAGYKFVGVIATLVISEVLNGPTGGGTGGWVGWSVFLYTYLANAFFLLRSLKYVLLPDQSNAQPGAGGGSYTLARAQRNRRTQFLFVYAYVVQFGFMWALSRQDPAAAVQSAAASSYKAAGNLGNSPPSNLVPGGAAVGKGGAVA